MKDYLSGERPVKYVTQEQFEDMDSHALEWLMERYNVQVMKEEKEKDGQEKAKTSESAD